MSWITTMLQKTKKINFTILALSDCLSTLISWYMIVFASKLMSPATNEPLKSILSAIDSSSSTSQIWLGVSIVIMLICHVSLGLYQTSTMRESIRSVFRRLLLSAVLSVVAIQILQFLVPTDNQISSVSWLICSTIAVCAHIAVRYAVWIKGWGLGQRKILVLGAGERAAFFPNRIRRISDRKYWKLVGFVPLKTQHAQAPVIHPRVHSAENLLPAWTEGQSETSISKLVDELDVSMIILANTRKEKIPTNELIELRMTSGIQVLELEDFVENELGQIAVEQIKPERLLTAPGYNIDRPWFDFAQYCMNLILALSVLFVVWPIMIIAAICIYFDDGKRDNAPIFFRQRRVGLHGKTFELYKFRSMGLHAEKNGAQWATANDSRVTRLGSFLRKYRIDELPQLLNVVRGDMLFVGPRPERPEFVSSLSKDIPYFTLRHSVKPGLTGWAQINFGYVASQEASYEKLKFDLFYIKHRSLMLDWYILFRTVEVVLLGRGQ